MPFETWFPTVIFFEDLELELSTRESVLEAVRERIEPHLETTGIVVTATNAENDLHLDQRLAPLFEALRPVLRRFLFEVMQFDEKKLAFYVGRCWPVAVWEDTTQGVLHIHHGAVFSGVLFLKAPEGSGALTLYKPFSAPHDALEKSQHNPLTFRSATYAAVENRLVLFSSALQHKRLPNQVSGGERLAIAFDIYTLADLDARTSGMPDHSHLVRIS